MCFDISYALQHKLWEVRFSAAFRVPDRFEPAYHTSAFWLPDVPVITNDEPEVIQLLKWGLIPSWVKDTEQAEDIRTKTFNARAESVFKKPSFRHSIRKKRCMVLVDGFYEWRQVEGRNYPYFIRMADREPFALAGLWEAWYGPDGGGDRQREETGEGEGGVPLQTFTVVTTRANTLMERIHNKKKRMPVILPREEERAWLDNDLEDEGVKALMEPIDDSLMEAHTVSRLVSMKGRPDVDTNVPGVRERHDYEELRTEQRTLF